MVRGEGGGRLHHDGRARPEANLDEVVVHRTHREHGGDGGHRRVAAVGLVGDDHRLGPARDSLLGGGAELGDGGGHRSLLASARVPGRDANGFEGIEAHDGLNVLVEEHGGLEVHRGDVFGALVVEEVPLGAQGHLERHDEALAQRVNRRVGHLRKPLLEVVVEEVGAGGEHGHRGVVTHGPRGLHAVGGHGLDDHGDVLRGVPRRGLRLDEARGVHGRRPGLLGVEELDVLQAPL